MTQDLVCSCSRALSLDQTDFSTGYQYMTVNGVCEVCGKSVDGTGLCLYADRSRKSEAHLAQGAGTHFAGHPAWFKLRRARAQARPSCPHAYIRRASCYRGGHRIRVWWSDDLSLSLSLSLTLTPSHSHFEMTSHFKMTNTNAPPQTRACQQGR